jgi:5'-nucleotidase
LNVNVPNLTITDLKGTAVTRLGKRIYHQLTVERVDPRGKKYYWIGGGEPEWEHEPGTDFDAIDRGMVSVTPLHLDLTDYAAFERMRPVEKLSFEHPAKHEER